MHSTGHVQGTSSVLNLSATKNKGSKPELETGKGFKLEPRVGGSVFVSDCEKLRFQTIFRKLIFRPSERRNRLENWQNRKNSFRKNGINVL